MKLFTKLFLLFLFAFLPEISTAQHFIEYQDSANIDHIFKHTSFMGGGAVFFDYDNDGDDDLYITAGKDQDHFYENNGDGTFTNRSAEAGFMDTGSYYTTGVIAGDIDNDGFKDLFITTGVSGSGPLDKNLLYKNNGDGTFSEIWDQQGEQDKTQAMGATFIDYDLDGLLDIYVGSYVDEVGFIYDDDDNIIGFDHTCFSNTLYHNIGNAEFEEIGAIVNVDDNGCALAVTSSDFDLDGDMDIYVANDFGEFVHGNRLFENNPDNSNFENVSYTYNADIKMYGMGIAVGDIDNDLDLDYYVTNFGKNAMLRNDGNVFTNITDLSGTGDEYIPGDSLFTVGWGTAFLDVDNDTDLDLYIANGYVPSPGFLPSYIYQNDILLLNNGNSTFEDAGPGFGIENKYSTRGMSYSDYDNDGDLDIISVIQNIPPGNTPVKRTVLYNNQMGNEKNWLQVMLEGVIANRDAYGSKIYLYAGDKIFLQEVSGGSSHASHVSSRVHFGLNDLSSVDSLTVVWTGGNNYQTLYDLPINQIIHIKEDTTSVTPTFSGQIKNDLLFSVFPNPAKGKLTIELKNNSQNIEAIEIYNQIGGLRERIFINGNKRQVDIKLEGYVDGLYFLKIILDGKYVSKKIFIQK